MGNDPKIKNLFIPQVSKLPGQKQVDIRDKLGPGDKSSEFADLLKNKIEKDKPLGELQQNNVKDNISLSLHAAKRLKERNIEVDNNEFFKLKDAIEKLKTKGGRDSLVITPKAAYIIDVNNNTIVTAVDRESMNENVFTKIDSTMVLN